MADVEPVEPPRTVRVAPAKGVRGEPVAATLYAFRANTAKVVYLHSRTGAWVARSRITEEEEHTVPPRKKRTTTPPAAAAVVVAEPETGARSLVHVDPATLVLGPNVRVDAALDKEFVASVKELGVLQPIVAHRDDEGRLVVLRGGRRTRAAVETKQPTVPVYVVDAPTGPDRIVEQLVENTNRADITKLERVAAFTQLALLGVSPAQIAKRTATPRADVDAVLKVAKSEVAAREFAARAEVTLEQAAAIAEFDDDPDRVASLVYASEHGGFDHAVQRARDAREYQAKLRRAEDALIPAGIRRDDDEAGTLLHYLTGPDGHPLAEDTHLTCPGHAAYLQEEYDVDPADPDEEIADDEHLVEGTVYTLHFVCTDPDLHKAPATDDEADGQPAPAAAKLTKAEAKRQAEEAKRLAEETRREAEEKAGRKAWAAAKKVRRDWLRQLAQRKTAPKGAAAFLAAGLLRRDSSIGGAMYYAPKAALGYEWLGIEVTKDDYAATIRPKVDAYLANVSDGRALVVALVFVLAAIESDIGEAWVRYGDRARSTWYFRYLESAGYELSDIELAAVNDDQAEGATA